MKKIALLLLLITALWHNDAMAYGEDSFFRQSSMSEPLEYELYDSYMSSEQNTNFEATEVSLGSGIVFLGVLALVYGAKKLKTES